MHIQWEHVVTALGLALLFEGLPYFLWAEKMPRFLLLLATKPPSMLRRLGLTAMLGGLLLIYLAQG